MSFLKILTKGKSILFDYKFIKLGGKFMRLFLCSHFSSVGSLIKEEINMKKVLFIPTASIYEEYKGYVGSARKLFKKFGAVLTEMDISKEEYENIEAAFNSADIIYFTGGNSFFLLEQLRKKGVDKLLKEELNKGKLFIGESAGAIVCAPDIKYIEMMDEKPGDYSLTDDGGLSLINFYVLPHYLTAPFKKVTEKILEQFNDLDICPINNSQAVIVEGVSKRIVEI
jgi:dipeptidase E